MNLTRTFPLLSVVTLFILLTGCLDSSTSTSVNFDNEEDIEFLEKKAAEEGVEVTENGLLYKIIEEGEGEHPSWESTVKVYYTGKLIDGRVFDQGRSREKEQEPAQFPLDGVIWGFGEGVQQLKEGGKIELYIPTELGYGAFPPPGIIYPGAALVFEVELVEIL